MAKFWKHLKYHEDNTEKHKITEEEIQFLKDLQKEMNTQDHVGQADPRYWVIRDYGEICGQDLNNPDGYILYDRDSFTEVCRCESMVFGEMDIKETVEYLTENCSEDFVKEDFEYINDMDSLKELLEEKGYEDSFYLIEYETIPKYSGFFLTQKAAEEHLRRNDYYYADNATTYAMTAWRNPEADMLYRILQSVDFDKLN